MARFSDISQIMQNIQANRDRRARRRMERGQFAGNMIARAGENIAGIIGARSERGHERGMQKARQAHESEMAAETIGAEDRWRQRDADLQRELAGQEGELRRTLAEMRYQRDLSLRQGGTQMDTTTRDAYQKLFDQTLGQVTPQIMSDGLESIPRDELRLLFVKNLGVSEVPEEDYDLALEAFDAWLDTAYAEDGAGVDSGGDEVTEGGDGTVVGKAVETIENNPEIVPTLGPILSSLGVRAVTSASALIPIVLGNPVLAGAIVAYTILRGRGRGQEGGSETGETDEGAPAAVSSRAELNNAIQRSTIDPESLNRGDRVMYDRAVEIAGDPNATEEEIHNARMFIEQLKNSLRGASR